MEFETDPPIQPSSNLNDDKFEADGTVQNVYKKHSGRSQTLMSPTN